MWGRDGPQKAQASRGRMPSMPSSQPQKARSTSQQAYSTPVERSSRPTQQYGQPTPDSSGNPFLSKPAWKNSAVGSLPTPTSSVGEPSPLPGRTNELKRFCSMFGHEGGRSISQDFDGVGRPKVPAAHFVEPQRGPLTYSHSGIERGGMGSRNSGNQQFGSSLQSSNFTGDIDLDITLDAGGYMDYSDAGRADDTGMDIDMDMGEPDFDADPAPLLSRLRNEEAFRPAVEMYPRVSDSWSHQPQAHDYSQRPNMGSGSYLHSRYQRNLNGTDTPPRNAPYQASQPMRTHPAYPSHSTRPNSTYNPAGQSQKASPAYSYKAAGPVASGIPLRAVVEMPDKYRSLFSFPYFNAVQSHCFDLAFRSDRNLVVSAPTGSGKTCIMELAILYQLSQPDGDNAKVVYMAPTKALCNERTKDWQQKFRTLGITCNELTGDTDNLRTHEIQRSNIIVTTPEKWDSMTRRWRDYKNLMGLLRLIMIDECHSLNEAVRGATLEVVISRMKTVNRELQREKMSNTSHFANRIRFLALSATVPNIRDFAEWLKEADGSPAEVRIFGEEFRPVQLQKEVLGFYANSNNYFQFESSLDYKLMEVIERFSSNKPTLVFCATRKSVTNAAERLVRQCAEMIHATGQYGPQHPWVKTRQQSESLKDIKSKLTDKKLAELVVHGVAFHNGGLNYQDRHLIESSFLKGVISVICATSTLAVGVNLPAHLVIIKGTMQYVGNAYVEYSELDIMQMLGRAGRPQFDDSGVAVIMTGTDEARKYKDMVSGKQIIESSLHENLIEHLNSEVVLGAIKSVDMAIEWLQSSFLYVRMRKNPAHYKLKNCSNVEGKLSAERRLESICLRDVELLSKHGLVMMAPDQKRLDTTGYGRAMAKYYIKYQTAVTVLQMKPKATLRDALEVLCKAEEFADVRFHSDKGHLNALNKNLAMRFPVKGRVTSVEQKVNILIQCALASIPFTEQKSQQSMTLETQGILNQACRTARFMVEMAYSKEDLVTLRSCIDLCRCLSARTWENSPLLLKQIENIGPSLARMFANAGISTFEKLEKTDPRHIEFTVSRNPPFGNKVLEWAAGLPRFKMDISQFKELSRPTEIELYINAGLENAATARLYGKKGQYSAVFVAGTTDHVLVDYRRFTLRKLKEGQSFRIRFQLTSPNQRIMCSLLSEDFVGVDVHKEVVPEAKAIHFRNLRTSQALAGNTTDSRKAAPSRQCSGRSDDYFGDDILDESEIAALMQEVEESMNELSAKPVDVDETDYDTAYGGPTQADAFDLDDDPIPPLPSRFKNGGQYKRTNEPDLGRRDDGVIRRDDGSLMFVSNDDMRPPSKPRDRHVNDTTQQAAGNIAPGNVPCAHRCKNKQSCAHECCKIGIPVKKAAKRKGASNQNQNEYNATGEAEWGSQQRSSASQKPTRKPKEIVGLPSDNNYDDYPISDSDDNILLMEPQHISNTQPVAKTKPWQNKGAPRSQPVAGNETSSTIKPPRSKGSTANPAMMFLDLETDEDGGGESCPMDYEIEGEFDGWLVNDDEDLEENDAMEVDGAENRSPRKRPKDSAAPDLASEQNADADDIDDTPSKRRRLVRKPQVVESDEETDMLEEKSPTAELSALVKKSSFNQGNRDISGSQNEGTAVKGQVDFRTRLLLAKDDPFNFTDNVPQRGVLAGIHALNRLHDKTSSGRRLSLAGNMQHRSGRTSSDTSPDNIKPERSVSMPHIMETRVNQYRVGRSLSHSIRPVSGDEVDKFQGMQIDSDLSRNSSNNANPLAAKGQQTVSTSTKQQGQITPETHMKVTSPEKAAPSTQNALVEARASLSNWLCTLKVEDFVGPSQPPKHTSSQSASQGIRAQDDSAEIAPICPTQATIETPDLSRIPRPDASGLSEQARKEHEAILNVFADLL